MRGLLRPTALFVLMALVIIVAAGCSQPAAPAGEEEEGKGVPEEPPKPEVEFIVVSSGSPGGVYFPLGAGIAKIISDKVPGVFAQSESTAASVENCRLVGRGESEMGMAMGNVAYDAYVGQGAFDNDKQPLRALFSMYPAPQHLVVLERSPINSLEDLAGKKVSVDAAGSGCEVTSYIILEAAGIKDSVNTVNYSQQEAAEALKDGIVDAVFYNFAYPAAVVEEISSTHSIRLIPLENTLLDKVIANYPYFTKGTIPGNSYSKVPGDTRVLMVSNVMVCHENMDPGMAYEIVKAIYDEDSLAQLIGIHSIARQFSPEMGADTPIPLHPGAERFFREAGALK